MGVNPFQARPLATPRPGHIRTSKRLKYTLGIDLGDKTCHFTGVGGEEDITVAERDEVATTEEAFAAWFEGRAPMRIIVEVGTHAR